MGPKTDLSALILLALGLETDLKLRFAPVGTAEDMLREHGKLVRSFMNKLPSLVRGQCNCKNSKSSTASWEPPENSQRPYVRITVSDDDWPALPTGETLTETLRTMPAPWNRVAGVRKHEGSIKKTLQVFVSNDEEQENLLAEANQPGRIQKLFNFKQPSVVQPEHFLVQVQGVKFFSSPPSQDELNGYLEVWSQQNGVNIVDADWRNHKLRVHLLSKDEANQLCEHGWFKHKNRDYECRDWDRTFDPFVCYKCCQPDPGHGARHCTKPEICLWCGDKHNIRECSRRSDNLRCPNCQGKHRGDSHRCTFEKTVRMFERLGKRINRGATWRRRIPQKDADGFELVQSRSKRTTPNSPSPASEASKLAQTQSVLHNYYSPLKSTNDTALPDNGRKVLAAKKRIISPRSKSPEQDKRICSLRVSPNESETRAPQFYPVHGPKTTSVSAAINQPSPIAFPSSSIKTNTTSASRPFDFISKPAMSLPASSRHNATRELTATSSATYQGSSNSTPATFVHPSGSQPNLTPRAGPSSTQGHSMLETESQQPFSKSLSTSRHTPRGAGAPAVCLQPNHSLANASEQPHRRTTPLNFTNFTSPQNTESQSFAMLVPGPTVTSMQIPRPNNVTDLSAPVASLTSNGALQTSQVSSRRQGSERRMGTPNPQSRSREQSVAPTVSNIRQDTGNVEGLSRNQISLPNMHLFGTPTAEAAELIQPPIRTLSGVPSPPSPSSTTMSDPSFDGMLYNGEIVGDQMDVTVSDQHRSLPGNTYHADIIYNNDGYFTANQHNVTMYALQNSSTIC